MHHIPYFFLQLNISVRHDILAEIPFCLLQKQRALGYGDPPQIEWKESLLGQGLVPPEADTYLHNYGVRHENDCCPTYFANANRLPNVM